MFTLSQLQDEMKPWVLHNFGERPSSQPLRGIVEEIGELMQALEQNDLEAAQDGVADCMIFMADYCNASRYSIARLSTVVRGTPPWSGDHLDDAPQLLQVLGRLNHHDLKKEQGIRKGEDHDQGIMDALAQIAGFLATLCSMRGWPSIETLVEKTWSKVKLRDWKKNAVTGT